MPAELSAAEQHRKFTMARNEPHTPPALSDQDAERLRRIAKAAKAGFVSKWATAKPGTNIAVLDFPYQPVTTDKDPIGAPLATMQDAEARLDWHTRNDTTRNRTPQVMREMHAAAKLRHAAVLWSEVEADKQAAEAKEADRAERLEARKQYQAGWRATKAQEVRDAKAEAWVVSRDEERSQVMGELREIAAAIGEIPDAMGQDAIHGIRHVKRLMSGAVASTHNLDMRVFHSRHWKLLPEGKTLKKKK